MKIFIDPGHGGRDPGAVSGNLVEKHMNQVTAVAVGGYLLKHGHQIRFSRTGDTDVSLSQRARLANDWGADLFVSIHYNAGGGDRGEVIHSVVAGKGKELAEHISAQLKVAGQSEVKIYSKKATAGNVTSVANLADSGVILSQAKNLPNWINTSKKKLSTIYVKNDGAVGHTKTDDLTTIADIKTAVSGIPIYPKVSMEEIKAEGYFGGELYNTSHGFLGIRQGKLIYVATSCGFDTMASIFEALGCEYGIKLDGGGSFILQVGGKIVNATDGNRRINAVGMFE